MSKNVQNAVKQISAILETTEKVLSKWNFTEQNMQIPALLEAVSEELGVSGTRDLKEVDNQIRYFLNHHSDYCARKGPGGGVTLTSMINAKTEAVAARKAAKEQAAKTVEAKLAQTEVSDSDETSEEEV